MESLERIENRKIERQLYIGGLADQNLLTEISQKDKALYNELTMKRSTTFRDPSKTLVEKKSSWEAYNQMPTKELRKFLRPNIVKMDQKAVQGIMDKIKNEEYINTMHRIWLQDHRQDLRDKLKERHNYQIELLKKSGLKKPFRRIGDPKFKSTDGREFDFKNGLSQLDNMSEFERLLEDNHDSIIYQNQIKPEEDRIITQRSNLESRMKLLSENPRYSSPIEREDSAVMSNQRISIDSVIQEKVQDLQKIRTMYYNTVPEKLIDDRKCIKTEREISNKTNDNFNRLHGLNKSKEVSSPYLASEFRGLLISDYDEALNNCDAGDYKTLTAFDRETLGSTRLRIGKRKSNATKELFPSPYDLTKYNIQKAKNLKDFKMGYAHNTATGFYSSTKNTDQNPASTQS